MTDTVPQEWPNERLKVLVPTVTLMVLSTLFLIWRVAYGIMKKRRFMVCDYLLVIAALLNIATTVLRFKVVDAGLGRHIQDPSVLKTIRQYSYLLWITQIINIYAVAVFKYSICAYLLVLNFSMIYRILVWLSILMITVCNFLIPTFTLFSCRPLEANWNRVVKGKCWAKSSVGLAYAQGVSNIVTDIIYIVAPLIYLSTIQLPRRTQWGIRIVFLLGVTGTVCSIFKTIELNSLTKTRDPTWDGINLTIWSATELSVGILIASLPPLRKVFDSFFKRILPGTTSATRRSRSRSRSHQLHMQSYQLSKVKNDTVNNDDGSERAILTEEERDKNKEILKTTQVTVTGEDGRQSFKNNWRNPHDDGVNPV